MYPYKQITLVTIWGLTTAAILRAEPLLARFMGSDHSICGRWGCGPPAPSLIVWNGFILVVTIPIATCLPRWSPDVTARWHRTVPLLTIIASIGFVCTNTWLWWRSATGGSEGYLIHRILFSLVAFVDAPVLPVIAASLLFWWKGRGTRGLTGGCMADIKNDPAGGLQGESCLPDNETRRRHSFEDASLE